MKLSEKFLPALVTVIVAVAVIVLLVPPPGVQRPAAATTTTAARAAVVDVDKASDCWTRPDRRGRRHCSTRKGDR